MMAVINDMKKFKIITEWMFVTLNFFVMVLFSISSINVIVNYRDMKYEYNYIMRKDKYKEKVESALIAFVIEKFKTEYSSFLYNLDYEEQYKFIKLYLNVNLINNKKLNKKFFGYLIDEYNCTKKLNYDALYETIKDDYDKCMHELNEFYKELYENNIMENNFILFDELNKCFFDFHDYNIEYINIFNKYELNSIILKDFGKCHILINDDEYYIKYYENDFHNLTTDICLFLNDKKTTVLLLSMYNRINVFKDENDKKEFEKLIKTKLKDRFNEDYKKKVEELYNNAFYN